jgi:hypothetical protein
MKPALLSITLVFLGFFSQAQMQKVIIYCEIHATLGGPKIDYYGVDAFLPDSIKAKVLIDYTNQYHFRNVDIPKIILMTGAQGWKLSSILPDANTAESILSREVQMDEVSRQLYLKKIGDSFDRAH